MMTLARLNKDYFCIGRKLVLVNKKDKGEVLMTLSANEYQKITELLEDIQTETIKGSFEKGSRENFRKIKSHVYSIRQLIQNAVITNDVA